MIHIGSFHLVVENGYENQFTALQVNQLFFAGDGFDLCSLYLFVFSQFFADHDIVMTFNICSTFADHGGDDNIQ